ncbi:MAG TPA: hypothetical protein VH247_02565 [Thermoleophilaceae bacterium]|jgi:hypothetical protein|nr:hypothetical protein [Thermoleophilaceae bacterium]
MTPEPDERIARLYGLPLEEFTSERNALAAELHAEGDSDRAATVKALRKPTAAAWAVNRLVRVEPDLVEALLGAGGELRQAHRQAASGKGALQLRAAADAERAAVEALVARAPTAIGRPLSPGVVDAIRNTLHAASSNDEAREQVRAGTLTTELRPVGLGPLPAPAPKRTSTAAEKKRATESARMLKAARASESALQREVDAARRALERAEAVYARAREAADAAAGSAQEARRRLREARAGLADAQRRRAEIEADR